MDEIKTTIPDQITEEEKDALKGISEEQIAGLLKQVREMMELLETHWKSSKNEFQLTDDHMKVLYQFNETHRSPMTDDQQEESYDKFNGLNNISEDEVLEIFGEGHPIIGIQHSLTIDRIKSVTEDFFNWMAAIKEYRQIHDGYMELIEYKEEQEIQALKSIAEKEDDPEKKSKMLQAVDQYYCNKYLDFLKDPLDNKVILHIIDAFSSEKKIQYWINRSRDKLDQLKISSKFILEVSQFEKRFLPEEYHNQNNIFLLYFMNCIVYTNLHSNDNDEKIKRTRIVCLIFAMDRLIRNIWKDDIRERILNNIIAFEDQFIGKLPIKENVNEE